MDGAAVKLMLMTHLKWNMFIAEACFRITKGFILAAMTIITELTAGLLEFLIRQGYSHLYSFGIFAEGDNMDESENFLLIPLKPGDPRLQFEEGDKVIDEITSAEVYEMVKGDPFITFFVELPEIEFNLFKIF